MSSPVRRKLLVAIGVVSISVAAMIGAAPAQVGTALTQDALSPETGGDPVFVGAGDIADCGDGAKATADLLGEIGESIFTLGDNAYESGSAAEYTACYDPTWGRFKERTHPTPGNHEYQTRNAADYFAYFGAAASKPGEGWYSFDLGTWHIIALNSNCAQIGGCDSDSPQQQWLRADLAAHPAVCTLAYWHHPRFSSGVHGSEEQMAPIWQALADAGADVVLSGHDHDYERFAPQDPDGRADPTTGIREFVAGTGGAGRRGFDDPLPTSEIRNSDTWGVLKLTLHPNGYDWEFVPVAGQSFHDAGPGTCH